ncbi:hypothetical protein EJ05DRAFT_390391 [Pseudovirgaria hyperparasitica]|uniref:Uncharacterized protein n=1 Tax=Pseudovirgaria hyperparasitica TaxID=470096 RepID=A0A6A6W3M9_9PEZI|nr:uncharacterized protein EJ05DRAFT_390391 [Pseudovirgaria hyperparasitica]KAF2757462.1 hypothetical protein EJ05DRAFT_390391 [Pseudovirgaria hyperparasitica]
MKGSVLSVALAGRTHAEKAVGVGECRRGDGGWDCASSLLAFPRQTPSLRHFNFGLDGLGSGMMEGRLVGCKAGDGRLTSNVMFLRMDAKFDCPFHVLASVLLQPSLGHGGKGLRPTGCLK